MSCFPAYILRSAVYQVGIRSYHRFPNYVQRSAVYDIGIKDDRHYPNYILRSPIFETALVFGMQACVIPLKVYTSLAEWLVDAKSKTYVKTTKERDP